MFITLLTQILKEYEGKGSNEDKEVYEFLIYMAVEYEINAVGDITEFLVQTVEQYSKNNKKIGCTVMHRIISHLKHDMELKLSYIQDTLTNYKEHQLWLKNIDEDLDLDR